MGGWSRTRSTTWPMRSTWKVMASSLSVVRTGRKPGEEKMAIATNTAKARLKRNQLAIGIGVRLVRNVDIIKVMKAAGFDWLFLDLEHGAMSIQNAAEICGAAQDSGIAPILRVPYRERAIATRLPHGRARGLRSPPLD